MRRTFQFISIAVAVAGVLALVSMRGRSSVPGPAATVAPAETKAAIWNGHAIDSVVRLLRQGQVVLRMGTGAQSLMLAHINRRDKSYSHCGIVIMENGYPFVYHSIGGEDNPDARLRRDSAHRFFSPSYNSGIAAVQYDLSDYQQAALYKVVKNYFARRPRFDLQFDLATDDKLYCTEFVYKAITKATADTSFIPISEALGRRFVGTDDLWQNSHASLIWQVRFK